MKKNKEFYKWLLECPVHWSLIDKKDNIVSYEFELKR